MTQICVTCGTQFPPSGETQRSCPICRDERQFIGPQGQEWISLDELRKTHRNVFFEEGWSLWGIHTEPEFGIGQRALLLQRRNGGILWDCVSLIDASTVGLVKALGGLSAIAVSHPHYYSCMVEWSPSRNRDLGNVGIDVTIFVLVLIFLPSKRLCRSLR